MSSRQVFHRPPRRRADAGSAVVEAILLTPLLVGFLLLVTSAGLLVNLRAQVMGAARDAARAGALQRSYPDAVAAARLAAARDLGGRCDRGLTVTAVGGSAGFTPGGLFTVEVRCSVPLAALQLLALPDTVITTRGTAPLDVLVRIEDPP